MFYIGRLRAETHLAALGGWVIYLQHVVGNGSPPLHVPPDVLVGIDHNFNGFGTRVASLDHLQRQQRGWSLSVCT